MSQPVNWERLAANQDWLAFWSSDQVVARTLTHLESLIDPSTSDPEALGRARGALATLYDLERLPAVLANETERRPRGLPLVPTLMRAAWLQRIWSWINGRPCGLPRVGTTPTASGEGVTQKGTHSRHVRSAA